MLVDTGSSLKYILFPIHLAMSEHVFGGVYTYTDTYIYICIFIPHVYLQVMAILFNFELQYVMIF